MESKRHPKRVKRADSAGALESECETDIPDDIKKFIADSDEWGEKNGDEALSFAEFCVQFNATGGGSGMIQRGGNGESIIIESDIGNALMKGETDSQMPMKIKVFLNKATEGTKSYLLFAHETGEFLLINGHNGFQKFKGYVYVGAFYALNTTIIQYICEGNVVLWTNSTAIVPAIKYVASNALNYTSTFVALVTAGVGKTIPPVLNLAGINPVSLVVAGVVCACLAAYLGYRFFKVVENTELTEDQIKQIEQFRVKALIEKFKVHAEEIGKEKVKIKNNEHEIAKRLVEIDKLLIKNDPVEMLKKYSELFEFVNQHPIQRLSIAYLYASYVSTLISKYPKMAVETTLGDVKQLLAILGGVNTDLYPDLADMPANSRVQLFKLEFNNIFNDFKALFVAVSGPVAAAGLISDQLTIFGNRVGEALTNINGTLNNVRDFVQETARDAGVPILDVNVFQVRPLPSTGGSSSRRRKKSSRKPRNKRKTIRKKVSKTKNIRKRTLNKKSKKRSKKLRR